MMKKRYWILLFFLMVVAVTYFLGPVPENPVYSTKLPDIPTNLSQLESYIKNGEDSLPVRKDNQARILWHKDQLKKTKFSIVYLHGFAGSYRDGYPVNIHIADTLNANIYLSRWSGHGLKPPKSLNQFSAENSWQSAKEALVIGNRIGEKVIIMSTSTGGTLAIKLAAEFPELVFAIINLSPNIKDDQRGSFILNSPWGYEIAELISFGDHKKIEHKQEIAKQYWDTIYPSRALVDLQVLVSSTMKPATFKMVQCPVLTLYYHKNFLKEDEHVEVSAYDEAYQYFATPDSLKKLEALKTPGTHFIGSDIKSADYKIVEKKIMEFLKHELQIDLDSLN